MSNNSRILDTVFEWHEEEVAGIRGYPPDTRSHTRLLNILLGQGLIDKLDFEDAYANLWQLYG